MLYLSTRNRIDSFTSYRALRMDYAPDGGYIIPMRVPVFDKKKMENMIEADFSQNVADVINLFSGTNFTSWDVESAIGKQPIQIVTCGQKIMLARCWKNPRGNISYFINRLYGLVCGNKDATQTATQWGKIAMRISLITATVFSLYKQFGVSLDIAVGTGDFEQAFAALYCRKMGVPIRKIIIACNENSGIWDFTYHGAIHCGAPIRKTDYPAMDKSIPDLFELYLYLSYGLTETERFLACKANGSSYQLPEDSMLPSADDLFVSVVGGNRIPTVIASFCGNNSFSIGPYTAFSLGALQDYRAKAGEGNLTVVFDEDGSQL